MPRICSPVRSLACASSLIAVSLSALACQGSAPPPEPSREARAEAADVFNTRCARCHGPLGKGDGPDAVKLSTRPRNFADPTWQLAISDRHLAKVIIEGGTAVGKSAEMPGNPDLADKPEVMVALRQHVRVLAYTPPIDEAEPEATLNAAPAAAPTTP